MKLRINQYLNLIWFCLTLRSFKSATFFYYTQECGMIETVAYKKSIEITKQEFTKNIKPKIEYEYGQCNNREARRHKVNGNVQFILWKAGEQGHKEDCWINFDKSHWSEFKNKKSL